MAYNPTAIPDDCPAGLKSWLADQLRLISLELQTVAALRLKELAAAPARPVDGMIVYADGSNWDPGSGEGVYAYENGSWTKL